MLGSALTSAYTTSMERPVADLPPEAPTAASDSVGAAHEVAGQLGGDAAASLVVSANQAFVDAMSTTASIAAAFLPARARSSAALDDSPVSGSQERLSAIETAALEATPAR